MERRNPTQFPWQWLFVYLLQQTRTYENENIKKIPTDFSVGIFADVVNHQDLWYNGQKGAARCAKKFEGSEI